MDITPSPLTVKMRSYSGSPLRTPKLRTPKRWRNIKLAATLPHISTLGLKPEPAKYRGCPSGISSDPTGGHGAGVTVPNAGTARMPGCFKPGAFFRVEPSFGAPRCGLGADDLDGGEVAGQPVKKDSENVDRVPLSVPKGHSPETSEPRRIGEESASVDVRLGRLSSHSSGSGPESRGRPRLGGAAPGAGVPLGRGHERGGEGRGAPAREVGSDSAHQGSAELQGLDVRDS